MQPLWASSAGSLCFAAACWGYKDLANRDLIVIGASAGGLEALQALLGTLPVDLNAAVLVVLHTSIHAGSMLANILKRAGRLPVVHPPDRTRMRKGTVYIAPPDFHMLVERGVLRVIQGPRENLHRPAIDPLFRSAASYFGRRVIGVILTGLLDDGTSGLMVVDARGGQAIVQDPGDALYPTMPKNALKQVPAALVAPLSAMPDLLVRLTQEELPAHTHAHPEPDSETAREIKFAELDMAEIENEGTHNGLPSVFACPDCGGVLWEVEDNGFLRFRCRVGHAFTALHLGAEQRQAIETALWSALRALEENASLYHRMAERAEDSRHHSTAKIFQDRATTTESNARILRELLLEVNQGTAQHSTVEAAAVEG
jgi:two-component system, chemotaxis family, protein-glutamate methylesterase/glutaminase